MGPGSLFLSFMKGCCPVLYPCFLQVGLTRCPRSFGGHTGGIIWSFLCPDSSPREQSGQYSFLGMMNLGTRKVPAHRLGVTEIVYVNRDPTKIFIPTCPRGSCNDPLSVLPFSQAPEGRSIFLHLTSVLQYAVHAALGKYFVSVVQQVRTETNTALHGGAV